MILNIEKASDSVEQVSFVQQAKKIVRSLSVAKLCTLLCLISGTLLIFYLCKTYIRTILVWLENQDSVIILMVIVVLFVIVSFPVTVGYIVLVTTSGYLFGVVRGFTLSVIGANCGVGIAHLVIKFIGHHNSVRTLMETDIARAITRVINGPLCFKIVLCTRLTPIPFGLQNTIFAVSD